MKFTLKNTLFTRFHNQQIPKKEYDHIASIKHAIHADTLYSSDKKNMNSSRLFQFKKPIFYSVGIALMIIVSSFVLNKSTSKPVSAQELVQEAKKRINEVERLSFETTKSGIPFAYPVPGKTLQEDSLYVDAPKTTSRYWIDFKTGNNRYESTTDESYSIIDPTVKIPAYFLTNIRRQIGNGKEQLFSFKADEKTKKGVYINEGVMPKSTIQTTNSGRIVGMQFATDPKKEFTTLLDTLAGKDNITFETVHVNGKEYYTLTVLQDVVENYREKEFVEQPYLYKYVLMMDAKTYFPYKEIKYFKDDKAIQEYTYSNFSTEFENDVFELTAPEGYGLMKQGAFKLTDKDSLALVSCNSEAIGSLQSFTGQETCEGAYGYYNFTSAIYTDGKNSIKFQPMLPGIFQTSIVGVTFKLFQSTERFATKELAEKDKDIQFIELEKSNMGFIEKKSLGAEKYALMRLEVWDENTNKKIQEIFTAVDTSGEGFWK